MQPRKLVLHVFAWSLRGPLARASHWCLLLPPRIVYSMRPSNASQIGTACCTNRTCFCSGGITIPVSATIAPERRYHCTIIGRAAPTPGRPYFQEWVPPQSLKFSSGQKLLGCLDSQRQGETPVSAFHRPCTAPPLGRPYSREEVPLQNLKFAAGQKLLGCLEFQRQGLFWLSTWCCCC